MSPTASSRPTPAQTRGWGVVFVVAGSTFIAMAAGWIPFEPAPGEAPPWVLGAAGGVFFWAGTMMIAGDRGRWSNLMAGLLIGCMAAIGAWVTLAAPVESISGGIPFAPSFVNAALARFLFGAGSLICAALAVYALRLFWRGTEAGRAGVNNPGANKTAT